MPAIVRVAEQRLNAEGRIETLMSWRWYAKPTAVPSICSLRLEFDSGENQPHTERFLKSSAKEREARETGEGDWRGRPARPRGAASRCSLLQREEDEAQSHLYVD